MVINHQKWIVRKFLVIHLRLMAIVFKLTLVIDVKLNIFDPLCPSLVEGLCQTNAEEYILFTDYHPTVQTFRQIRLKVG